MTPHRRLGGARDPLRAVATPDRAAPAPRASTTLRGYILYVARTLLADEGPESLTVRGIAAQARGSTMNVYSRFGGKDGVLDAPLPRRLRHAAGHQRARRHHGRPRRRPAPVLPLVPAVRPRQPDVVPADVRPVGHHPRPSAEAVAEAKATLSMLGERVQRALDAARVCARATPSSSPPTSGPPTTAW